WRYCCIGPVVRDRTPIATNAASRGRVRKCGWPVGFGRGSEAMNEFSYGPLDQRIGELERLLSTAPIFRSVPTGRPVVYGYIRSSHRRARYVRACRRVLERFCWQERLRLCGVFVDYGIA